MVKYYFLPTAPRCQCDICHTVKKPDGKLLFVDVDDNILGSLTVCFSCSQLLVDELGVDIPLKDFDELSF